jgi:hypothetical protein
MPSNLGSSLALSRLPLSSRHTPVLEATILSDHGKPVIMTVDATEKLYADFQLSATNAGGHSSLPRRGQSHSIVSLTGLGRLQTYQQQPDRP